MIYVSLTRRDNEKICRLFMTSAHRLTGSFVSLPLPRPALLLAFFLAFPRAPLFFPRIFRIFYFPAFDRYIIRVVLSHSHRFFMHNIKFAVGVSRINRKIRESYHRGIDRWYSLMTFKANVNLLRKDFSSFRFSRVDIVGCLFTCFFGAFPHIGIKHKNEIVKGVRRQRVDKAAFYATTTLSCYLIQ